jgi:hypothetical protein
MMDACLAAQATVRLVGLPRLAANLNTFPWPFCLAALRLRLLRVITLPLSCKLYKSCFFR